MQHPMMAVASRLMAEFPGHELTVLRIVADCADEHPEGDAVVIEEASRVRLLRWLRDHDNEAQSY